MAIDRCIEDCTTLSEILEDLLPEASPANAKLSKGSNFRTALRAVRQDGRIKKAQKALQEDKNELRLRIAERTMALVEENRDTAQAQLQLSQSIERLQKDAQHEAARSGSEIMNLQKSNQTETRQMYTCFTRLQLASHDENRKIGSNLQQLQLAGKEEIIACIVQHSQQFNQINSSLGLMEIDLNSIKDRGDDTMLLVKQLANAINQRTDGSAMICIRIPRTLYDPTLSVWKGFRAYTEKVTQITLPGGWIEEPFHVQDRQFGSFSNQEARRSYLAVSPYTTTVERLSWTRNFLGPSWSMPDFEAAYSKNQSWLSYFLCYETVAIRPVPLLRGPDEDGENARHTYKSWKEVMNRRAITGGSANTEVNQIDKRNESTAEAESASLYLQLSNLALSRVEDEKPSETQVDAIKIGIRRPGTFPADFKTKNPSEDEVESLKMRIRRSKTLPTNFKSESLDIEGWVRSMEDDTQRQRAQQVKPYVSINNRLLSATQLSENDDSVRVDIEKMLVRFEQTASYDLPELVQMMTTKAGSEADLSGRFEWGFQLVIARNEVNFQLLIFFLAMVTIWVSDPISSPPIQMLTDAAYRLLCAPTRRSFWPSLLLFGLRLLASRAAVRSWINYYNLIIRLARQFAAPNPAWESATKIKGSWRVSTEMGYTTNTLLALANLLSLSGSNTSWIGTLWGRLLCFLWVVWLCSMIISSLWSAKDWFKLHSNPQFRVYGLGSFLAIVVFLSSILASVQNKG